MRQVENLMAKNRGCFTFFFKFEADKKFNNPSIELSIGLLKLACFLFSSLLNALPKLSGKKGSMKGTNDYF